MKRAYMLVEENTDQAFLHRVLPPETTKDMEIVSAGSSSGMASLAQSLLVRRHTPVALFMDSHSLNPELIEERRGETEEFVRFSTAAVPVKVIVAVPELEAFFFAVPEVIERVMGEKVPDEFVPLGLRDPIGILDHLAKKSPRPWDTSQAIQMLDAQNVERIRALPAVSELIAFLRRAQGMEEAA